MISQPPLSPAPAQPRGLLGEEGIPRTGRARGGGHRPRRGRQRQRPREGSEAGSGGSSTLRGTPEPLRDLEAAGRSSAQALVQVGRGEEHVGGQAHSQEAPDQGGPEATSPGGGPLCAPLGGGVHYTGGRLG